MFFQASEDSEEDDLMPNKSAEVTKTRASVRMTRYLESWGAVKPFAHLNHRDSLIPEALSSSRIMVRIAHAAMVHVIFCIHFALHAHICLSVYPTGSSNVFYAYTPEY